jgi:large subunit ribosomal protein L25
MERFVIQASKRSITGKQVRALRRAGQLPGIVYGHNMEPISISMDAHEASLMMHRTTASSLIIIQLDGKEFPTLVREKQRNPVKDTYVHIDFQAVSLTEKIRAQVSIQLTGLSPAVKDFNAVLVTGLSEVEVEGFPQDLPQRIVVDITSLDKIGAGLYVRDIVLSDKVKMLDDPSGLLVLATAAKEEKVEEVVEEVAAVEGAEPEVVEKGKKEEEATEEKK